MLTVISQARAYRIRYSSTKQINTAVRPCLYVVVREYGAWVINRVSVVEWMEHIQKTCTKNTWTADVSHPFAVLVKLARRDVRHEVVEVAGHARPHTATKGDVETKPVRSGLTAT